MNPIIKPSVLRIRHTLCLLFFTMISISTFAQSIYKDGMYQFLSFEKIPTWTGVLTDWEKSAPEVHLYDTGIYKGHAQYVSVGLKAGISFREFKEQVRNPSSRKYMPFFLFDLRGMNVIIDDEKHEWAIRIEDYGYKDNPKEMEETCLRLLEIISEYIESESGHRSKGLMVLATNQKATPNISVASAINKKGYPNMTRSQLLGKVGGKKVEILNEGTGIGYLRYVKDDETSFHPSSKDILIYENLPKRVPPVKGIITLEPQTPLSHINLLARNRGTINLYATDLKYLPRAKQLIGKLVKIECSNKKISISEISQKDAEKIWASQAVKAEIPKAITTLNTIVSLNTKHKNQTTAHVGAKASNYATIRQSFPEYVRQGYAIPFSHYFNTIENCGANDLILSLLKEKPKKAERDIQLKKIRTAIKNAQLNPVLIKNIRELISEKFNGSRIRLRSSTNCEDLPEFNGAGLYLSKGFNSEDSDKTLEQKILKVYASLWKPIAFEEREYYFIDHSKAGMAILINQAFPDEYANGVAITTVEKNGINIHINTQYGENSVTNPTNGQIPESIVYKSAQSNKYELISKSNLHDIFLQNNLESQLSQLKNTILDMHKKLTRESQNQTDAKFGIDIEFKIMEEQGKHILYIKQARLLRTVLPK